MQGFDRGNTTVVAAGLDSIVVSETGSWAVKQYMLAEQARTSGKPWAVVPKRVSNRQARTRKRTFAGAGYRCSIAVEFAEKVFET